MSMERYDWKSKINSNILTLRVIGLWPKGDKTYEPGLYMAYASITLTLFAVGHILFQVINLYFITDSLESFAATSYLLFIEILGGVKAYFLVKNMKIVKERLIIVESDWFQPKNLEQRRLVEPSLDYLQTVYRMFLAMCFGCNTFWATYPLMDRTSKEGRLPFWGWYPYNYKQSPYYEITYVYQVMGICFLTNVHLSVDNLISAFNVYAGCHFDILCDNLKNIGETGDAFEDMMKCFIHHNNILSFIESYAKFSNWILFWHLLFSGVSIGITMFQLSMVVPWSNEYYSLLSYGLAITIQIFMYCWFGNDVQVKSNNLSYAVFECNWTALPQDVKKKLLFFTMHLKPVQISAFNLFYLSVDTYLSILKTAWSYFTLLSQVSKR